MNIELIFNRMVVTSGTLFSYLHSMKELIEEVKADKGESAYLRGCWNMLDKIEDSLKESISDKCLSTGQSTLEYF